MFEKFSAPWGRSKILILVIVIAVIWIALGGFYLWQKYNQGKTPAIPVVNTPILNEAPAGNTNVDVGHLPSSGNKQTEEEPPAQGYLGYIKTLEENFGTNYLTIDYVQWLTGDAAKKAALLDGQCQTLADCAPNGFYIRNLEATLRRLIISPDVEVTMQTYSHAAGGNFNYNQKISFSDFKKIYAPNADKKIIFLRDVPYNIEIQNNQVVKIIEKYVP